MEADATPHPGYGPGASKGKGKEGRVEQQDRQAKHETHSLQVTCKMAAQVSNQRREGISATEMVPETATALARPSHTVFWSHGTQVTVYTQL